MSVIVPVRNGARDVEELLECLAEQSLPRSDFEVVIGDDGSRDRAVHDSGTPDGHVRVVAGPPLNSYAARNRAVAESRAPLLAFCDADCRPASNWLEEGLIALAETDIAAGRIRFDVPEHRTAWALVDMDGSKDHEHQVRVGVAETANLFVRRDLFERVDGFDDSIPEYGDYEFVERCIARGARLSYAPHAVVRHPVRTTAGSLLGALWKYNRGYAVHAGRSGEIPDAVKLRSWIPLVQAIRGRRRWGRTLGPDRRWLRDNGVEPTFREVLRALPILYLVVPYLRSLAQLRGWLDGRRLRVEGAAPSSSDRV